MSRIVILGGSGYIGYHIISRLAKNTSNAITVLARQKNCQVDTRQFSYVKFKTYPKTDESITALLENTDVVINLVGTMDSSRKRALKAHVELVQKYAELAKKSSVKHFIHFSALGVSEGSDSVYFQTKWKGEKILKQTLAGSNVKISIVKPSFVYGYRAPSIDALVRMINIFPVFMLPGAFAKFQPVFVGDLALAVERMLEMQSESVEEYTLVGDEKFTFLEMLRDVMRYSGLNQRKLISMPNFMAYILALITGWIPKAPFTLNQYKCLKVDNVSENCDFTKLNIAPQTYQSVMSYEYKDGLLDRYDKDRRVARRSVI